MLAPRILTHGTVGANVAGVANAAHNNISFPVGVHRAHTVSGDVRRRVRPLRQGNVAN